HRPPPFQGLTREGGRRKISPDKVKETNMKKAASKGASIIVRAFTALTLLHAAINRGTIQGTVTDAQGAVVPGVTVTVTDRDTGTSQTTKTNGAGFYFVPELVSGSYAVRFGMSGFVPTE